MTRHDTKCDDTSHHVEGDLLEETMLLARVARLVLEDEVLRSIDEPLLNPVRVGMLRLLNRQKRQSVNEIAHFLGATKAAASQNVECLVQAGFVVREHDETDRRCVRVSITPKGKRLLRKLEESQRRALDGALAGLSPKQIEVLSSSMRAFATGLLHRSEVRSDACLQCCAYNSAGCTVSSGDWQCKYLFERQGEAATRQ